MHDFDIKQGFSETTVMFCKKCGKSYTLATYKGRAPSKTVWEATPFTDHTGQDIDPPCKPCEQQEEYTE
jgi:hypothetical protein